jgi:hypothetical protein
MAGFDGVDMNDISSMNQVLKRTPNGEALGKLSERLGLITGGVLQSSVARKAFVHNISALDEAALSDAQSYWGAEQGRVISIIGLLQAEEKVLAMQAKEARSRIKNSIRAEARAQQAKFTETEVKDRAEEHVEILDIEERSQIVEVMLAVALASKEATTGYLTVISREISFRCARMAAGIYAGT